MAVDLVGVPRVRMEEQQAAIQEAASAGLKSMEHLIRLLASQTPSSSSSSSFYNSPSTSSSSSLHNNNNNNNLNLNCSELTDFTVSKFKQVINLLNRTGHARFRRAPPQPKPEAQAHTKAKSQAQIQGPGLTLDFAKPAILNSKPVNYKDENALNISPPVSTTTSSFMSSITGDASVSDGKIGPFLTPPATAPSAGKPPLSSSHRKRCHDAALSGKASSSGQCHCSKRRKSRVKRTIRVPAISSKIADIPPDEFSWRKYGQKPIKGSTYPRGYYKCSTVRGCPARKHVERAQDDPKMLIVTYEGEHRHNPQPHAPEIVTATAAAAFSLRSS